MVICYTQLETRVILNIIIYNPQKLAFRIFNGTKKCQVFTKTHAYY